MISRLTVQRINGQIISMTLGLIPLLIGESSAIRRPSKQAGSMDIRKAPVDLES